MTSPRMASRSCWTLQTHRISERSGWCRLTDNHRPGRIPNSEGGREPKFAPDGEILFRRGDGTTNFAYRIRPDGSRLRKALEQEVILLFGDSRDGRWIVA